MTYTLPEEYRKLAKEARLAVLDMVYKAQTSHIGSNFSCIDILSVLFTKTSLIGDNRDKVIFSKGWVAASAYYFLSYKGFIPAKDLETYCLGESKYIGLVEKSVNGIEASTGSMGHGLPIAVGMAIAKKLNNEQGKVFVLMSDGEMNCGTTWESALLAAHHKLDNLIVIVDCNGLQAMGKTSEVLKTEPLKAKWHAFGWEVREIGGHNFKQIQSSLFHKPLHVNQPRIILARTTKGKGVSFMENSLKWHYANIDDESYLKAKNELYGKS